MNVGRDTQINYFICSLPEPEYTSLHLNILIDKGFQ